MALREEEERQVQNPSLVLDALLCEEDSFEENFDNGIDGESENFDETMRKPSFFPLILLENDLFWEDDELASLISKEGETYFCFPNLISDGYLEGARKEAVNWIVKVIAHYGFSALTTVLAVNYFDRFITSLRFQRDKPWMNQLAVVACISLAAKVEETQVPLLLDLQVGESKYVFEAKTIQRMELLVLSTLNWRMNPVTPISFFEHIVRRLGLRNRLHWEFLCRCERLLLSVIGDSRVMSYLPSTLAAATMIHVIREIEPCNAMEYQDQLLAVLKISEENVNQCYKAMLKLLDCHGVLQSPNQKRKQPSVPGSPNGVINASFSCDSSNDSWTVSSSVSLEPPLKRSRAQDQQMQLPSLNCLSVDLLGSPR
ncbi:Cyclin d3 [Quillaja saponaria]|uniref:B-like cyclin n=1 Tax=Quillaja saponaria TaxID=32244 RepID=A0AAD7PFD7_QUISA|nr:Cyclin d3 [Quillaja saponaria]